MSLNKTVLIVDDDVDLVSVLSSRFQSLGLETLTAHNLLSAVSKLDNCRPDILCVDVGLETGNGLNFLDLVQLDFENSKIPTVVLTGHNDPKTIEKCKQLNAHYVCKGSDSWTQVEAYIQSLIEADKVLETAEF